MKQLLILCDAFPPSFAPRMGYLCKYIEEFGWHATVMTEECARLNIFRNLGGDADVARWRWVGASGRWTSRLEWLVKFGLTFCFAQKDKAFERFVSRRIAGRRFDAVLCSSYHTFPLGAALRIARRLQVPLLADIRDVAEQFTGYECQSHRLPALRGLEKLPALLYKHISIARRNRVLRRADALTTVSDWHVRVLGRLNPHVELIFNGYDPELFVPRDVTTPKFVVVFTGRLLSFEMRDPSLFFEAARRLMDRGMLTESNFEIRWYVDEDSWRTLNTHPGMAPLAAVTRPMGLVQSDRIPGVLHESSVSLQLANKPSAHGPFGIMTTKLFEAIGTQKPVLCVRSDEDCLERCISESGIGVAARTADEAERFLLEQFGQWKEKGFTRAAVTPQAMELYSRRNQTGQFAELLDRLCGSRR